MEKILSKIKDLFKIKESDQESIEKIKELRFQDTITNEEYGKMILKIVEEKNDMLDIYDDISSQRKVEIATDNKKISFKRLGICFDDKYFINYKSLARILYDRYSCGLFFLIKDIIGIDDTNKLELYKKYTELSSKIFIEDYIKLVKDILTDIEEKDIRIKVTTYIYSDYDISLKSQKELYDLELSKDEIIKLSNLEIEQLIYEKLSDLLVLKSNKEEQDVFFYMLTLKRYGLKTNLKLISVIDEYYLNLLDEENYFKHKNFNTSLEEVKTTIEKRNLETNKIETLTEVTAKLYLTYKNIDSVIFEIGGNNLSMLTETDRIIISSNYTDKDKSELEEKIKKQFTIYIFKVISKKYERYNKRMVDAIINYIENNNEILKIASDLEDDKKENLIKLLILYSSLIYKEEIKEENNGNKKVIANIQNINIQEGIIILNDNIEITSLLEKTNNINEVFKLSKDSGVKIGEEFIDKLITVKDENIKTAINLYIKYSLK